MSPWPHSPPGVGRCGVSGSSIEGKTRRRTESPNPQAVGRDQRMVCAMSDPPTGERPARPAFQSPHVWSRRCWGSTRCAATDRYCWCAWPVELPLFGLRRSGIEPAPGRQPRAAAANDAPSVDRLDVRRAAPWSSLASVAHFGKAAATAERSLGEPLRRFARSRLTENPVNEWSRCPRQDLIQVSGRNRVPGSHDRALREPPGGRSNCAAAVADRQTAPGG